MFKRAYDALAFLEHHQLEPSVAHYALAFGYISDPGSSVAKAITALIDGGLRLTPEQAEQLALRHGSALPASQREQTIVRHTEELGSLTGEAYAIAQSLGDDVGVVVRHADDSMPGGEDLLTRLNTAERGLADLRSEFAKLKNAVSSDFNAPVDADHDELTQALSQVGARHIMERVARHDRGYVILMFSIDSLVTINRNFGTSVGDNVLNAFVSKLQTVFSDQEAIRWTGNEFVIILPDTTVTAAQIMAEEVLSLVENRRFKLRGTGEWIGVITASAGIVTDRGDKVDTLLDRAREKLADAVGQGGNRVRI